MGRYRCSCFGRLNELTFILPRALISGSYKHVRRYCVHIYMIYYYIYTYNINLQHLCRKRNHRSGRNVYAVMVFVGLTELTFSPFRLKRQNDRKYTFAQTLGADRDVADIVFYFMTDTTEIMIL